MSLKYFPQSIIVQKQSVADFFWFFMLCVVVINLSLSISYLCTIYSNNEGFW
jgi:hypothetical protein